MEQKDVMQRITRYMPQKNWTTTLIVGQIWVVWVPSVRHISIVEFISIKVLRYKYMPESQISTNTCWLCVCAR